MRTGKSNLEDEEYEEDELVAKREGPSSTSNANNSIGNSKGIFVSARWPSSFFILDPILQVMISYDVMPFFAFLISVFVSCADSPLIDLALNCGFHFTMLLSLYLKFSFFGYYFFVFRDTKVLLSDDVYLILAGKLIRF